MTEDTAPPTGGQPKRILVTGSRDWEDAFVIEAELTKAWKRFGCDPNTILVSGQCPTGADHIAEQVWYTLGLPVELHPANWAKYGKAAGPLRNREMVAAGADLCVAFIKNGSRGATHCLGLAQEDNIPCAVWRYDNH